MNANINNLKKLLELATYSSRRRPFIVLPPDEDIEEINPDIVQDKADWIIPEEIRPLFYKLSRDNEISNEDKILLIYEELCKKYVYDDNLISYIKKIDDDYFALPDWYGRDVDEEWEEKRSEHNRRVCYEVSRYLAKTLIELFKDNDNFDICIFWDKSQTHYYVGLTCNEYSLTLDLDDFNNIKDLTRIKTGLTADGIVVLEDPSGKFKSALDKFNKGRTQGAIQKIESEISTTNNNNENQGNATIEEYDDDITFLNNALFVLKDKYGIDSQGLFEYLKEIVDIKSGPETRKKIWKEIKGNHNEATRYIRCLVVTVNNIKYLIDVDDGILRPFDDSELSEESETPFSAYKAIAPRNWRDRYDGS